MMSTHFIVVILVEGHTMIDLNGNRDDLSISQLLRTYNKNGVGKSTNV